MYLNSLDTSTHDLLIVSLRAERTGMLGTPQEMEGAAVTGAL